MSDVEIMEPAMVPPSVDPFVTMTVLPTRNTRLNIHQRMHLVMQKVDYIQKEKKKEMMYATVSHDAVTAKVRPLLVEAGIIYYPVHIRAVHLDIIVQRKNGPSGQLRTEAELALRFVNIDTPTDFIDVACIGVGVDELDKSPGKAISYAVKYGLLKGLGLETGLDPDDTQDGSQNRGPAPKVLATQGSSLDLLKPADGAGAVPYKDMTLEGKTHYWEKEFEQCKGMNQFDAVVSSLTKTEPDNSKVREQLRAAYKSTVVRLNEVAK